MGECMSFEQHRGAAPGGPFARGADPRVGELDTALRSVEAIINCGGSIGGGSGILGPLRDSNRAISLTGPGGEWHTGVVIHPNSALGWYKVQVGGVGTVSCFNATAGSMIPVGVREIGGIAPNSVVIVFKPPRLPFGYICGVIPPQTLDGSLPNPDWLFQGGQSGYRREDVHKFPIKNLYRGGNVGNAAGQRPMDGTSLERGWISSTGLCLSLDDYALQLRVNEQCGLFMTLFDGWCRLAGMQLDIESLVHEESARDDEGEARHFKGIATYPWEALGLYGSGTKFTETYGDKEVQYTDPIGKIDLPKDGFETQPFYRYQEYGGYLGQGHLRMVAMPPKLGGKRQRKDDDYDEGLFAETIGIDGDYGLRSAKSVLIAKRCKIVIPWEKLLPEDGNGDDAQADTYKFSGKHGGGEEHKLKEVQVEGEYKVMRRIAGIDDLISHAVNWKALHPFHYHKADYRTKQESEQTRNFTRVQENLSFSVLESQPWLDDPTPKKLAIDHRYQDAEYYERESFLYLAPDGSVTLSSGMGGAVVITSDVRLEAPGDVQLVPGRDLVSLADQTILRSRGSIDLSSMKDVRVKAEKNLQLLGGNGGNGAVLIESKSEGRTQQFYKKYGEEVGGKGIIFKSKGVLAMYGSDIYARSGTQGDIILDAAQGRRDVQIKAKNFNVFCQKETNLYYGVVDSGPEVTQTYSFGAKNCLIDVKMLVGGRIVSFSGNGGRGGFTTDGRIAAGGGIVSCGRMADSKGGMIGKIPDGLTSAIDAQTSAAFDIMNASLETGKARHIALTGKFYGSQQVGQQKTIDAMGFSYRDVPSEQQYKTQKFRWAERRWEQMTRLGLASGGSPWVEKSVLYQGEEQYPFPGKKKWQEEPAFLQLASLTMFDAGQGQSKDRPYDEPKLSAWTPVTMASGHKLIRSE